MKVKFFYRDGNNYKCTWIQEVDNEYWNDFLTKMQNDEESIDNYLDKNYRSDDLERIIMRLNKYLNKKGIYNF
jgi:hypothetical protein